MWVRKSVQIRSDVGSTFYEMDSKCVTAVACNEHLVMALRRSKNEKERRIYVQGKRLANWALYEHGIDNQI
jgi:hypothetical protein